MARNPDGPAGLAPDSSPAALLLIDIINTFDFEGGAQLLEHAVPMADRLAGLKRRCKAQGIPCIYVNDHFGRWRSDFSALVEYCRKPEFGGREVVEKVLPEDDDYFVFKPMYSGFYQTTLELLLHHLGSQRVIITGLASNICVLCTANDAHMRGYEIWLPSDGSAARTKEEHDYAQLHFQRVLNARGTPIEKLPLAKLGATAEAEDDLSAKEANVQKQAR